MNKILSLMMVVTFSQLCLASERKGDADFKAEAELKKAVDASAKGFTIAPASFDDVQKNITDIVELSRLAFIKNHEITAHYLKQTKESLRPEFERLFDDHVVDMMQEINKHKGLFFLVKNEKDKVVGISVGRPYGNPALSHEYMNKVFASQAQFKEVMGGWWQLMEKYQASADDKPGRVYHQAMTAMHPDCAGKGVGTRLSQCVMETITQQGYAALVRETSSAPAHKVADKLSESCHVVTVDQQMNQPTQIPLVLRIQYQDKEKAAAIVEWFEGKKKSAQASS